MEKRKGRERRDFIGERGWRAVTNGGCKAMSPLPTPSPNRKERRKRGRESEGDRMLRELLTPWPTDCFLQYRMTNVARPFVRPSVALPVHMIIGAEGVTASAAEYRQDYRVATPKSLLQRRERGPSVGSFVRNIEFQCGGSPTNLGGGGVAILVGQGLIHVGRSIW